MFAELILPRDLSVDRDDVEDALAEAIHGKGVVTGAGTGIYGSNLDLDLAEGWDREELLAVIRTTILALGVSGATIKLEGDTEVTRLSG